MVRMMGNQILSRKDADAFVASLKGMPRQFQRRQLRDLRLSSIRGSVSFEYPSVLKVILDAGRELGHANQAALLMRSKPSFENLKEEAVQKNDLALDVSTIHAILKNTDGAPGVMFGGKKANGPRLFKTELNRDFDRMFWNLVGAYRERMQGQSAKLQESPGAIASLESKSIAAALSEIKSNAQHFEAAAREYLIYRNAKTLHLTIELQPDATDRIAMAMAYRDFVAHSTFFKEQAEYAPPVRISDILLPSKLMEGILDGSETSYKKEANEQLSLGVWIFPNGVSADYDRKFWMIYFAVKYHIMETHKLSINQSKGGWGEFLPMLKDLAMEEVLGSFFFHDPEVMRHVTKKAKKIFESFDDSGSVNSASSAIAAVECFRRTDVARQCALSFTGSSESDGEVTVAYGRSRPSFGALVRALDYNSRQSRRSNAFSGNGGGAIGWLGDRLLGY